ncbi:redox-sensing transcriptional repressor Rex, partial [Candidatus Aerophobetes bacterium]
MPKFKVPEVTVERLSIYLRAIKRLNEESILSSQELANLLETSDGQVRKDLAYFGGF